MSELALTIRQQEAVALLAEGHAPEETAAMLGISVRTLRRYLASDEMIAELRATYRERIGHLLHASLDAAPDALRTLRQIAADKTEATYARVAAARAVLEHHQRLYQSADLDLRLDELERRLEEREVAEQAREEDWR